MYAAKVRYRAIYSTTTIIYNNIHIITLVLQSSRERAAVVHHDIIMYIVRERACIITTCYHITVYTRPAYTLYLHTTYYVMLISESEISLLSSMIAS